MLARLGAFPMNRVAGFTCLIRRALTLGFALAGCAAWSAGAAAPRTQTLAPAPTPEVHGPVAPSEAARNELAAIDLLQQAAQVKTFAEAEPLLQRALAQVPEPGRLRGTIVCMLGARLLQQAYDDRTYQSKAIATAEECNRLMPDVPPAQMLSGMAKLNSGQTRAGGALLLAAFEADPDMLGQFDIPMMQTVFRQLRYAQQTDLLDKLRKFLVSSGYGRDDQSFFGEMALDVMAAAIARNSSSEALELLPQVMSPEYGLQLLVDRRFEPIWPMIEQWAGGDLKRQRDASVAAARARFKVDQSLGNRRTLADTLWSAGMRGEALRLLEEAVDDPKLWDEDRFVISLMASRYGAMLMFEGKADEAITMARRVNDANPPSKYGAAANLMPNLARMLIQAGHSQEALDLIERQMPAEGSLEDPAAFGFYAALRFCAYSRLDKPREARTYSSVLANRYASNTAALDLARACSTTEGSAPTYWSNQLRNPNDRSEVLVTFLRARSGIRTIDMLKAFGSDRFVPGNGPLNAAFEGMGRELPASYLPALRMWADDPPVKGTSSAPMP